MQTSTSAVIKRSLNMRAIRIFTLLALVFLTGIQGFSQPVWKSLLPNGTAGNPYVSGTNPTSLNARYGINVTGKVYLIVYNYNNGTALTSAQVKTEALAGVSGSKVFVAVLTVIAGQVNTSIGLGITGLQGSTYHTLYWVAENAVPTLQPTPVRITATTKPCPAINIAFAWSTPDQCVNKGSTLTLTYFPGDATHNPDVDGLYIGTQFLINWGDGTTSWPMSAAERASFSFSRSHTYVTTTACNYEPFTTVTSVCNPLIVKPNASQVVVHGLDTQGGGSLLIVNNATGLPTIQVCEGNTHVITLKDMSTWNCQNPIWLDLSPAPANIDPRTVQWLYGVNDAGTFVGENTIGQTIGSPTPVVVGGVNNVVRGTNGYTPAAIYPATYQGELSQTITIPATCRVGEYFNVYLRNWNKCNVYGVDAPMVTTIQIQVVASPSPPIAPSRIVCFGSSTVLTAASGANPGILLTWYANANKTGVLTTGTTYNPGALAVGTYTYYVADGAGAPPLCEGPVTAVTLTVNPLPAVITGTTTVCQASTTTLADATAGGTWSSATPAVATISAGGVVTGVSGGTSVISYTLPTGCLRTATVTVNPLPAVITGTTSVCIGLTTTLADVTAGGTWSSATPAVATVVAGTGVVTGVSGGTSVISYTLPTGCLRTATVTVNPLPAVITGTTSVCIGLTTTLADATVGGTWSSATPAVATISAVGVVTGVSGGTSVISYTLLTGCLRTATVTVNPLPAVITGTTSVCIGLTTTLADATAGGTWSSATPAVATVVAGTGVVTGVSGGTSVISYSLSTGCLVTASVTVNLLPTIISTGTVGAVCYNVGAQTTTMAYSSTTNIPTSYSIDWATLSDQSSTLNVFNPGAGNVTGIIIPAGTVAGTYTGIMTVITINGCTAILPVSVTVNPLPAVSAITGDAFLCNNATNKVYQVVNHGATSAYTWTVPGAILTKTFDANLYFILVDATGTTGSGNIQLTETIIATGCSATAVPFNVTVSPVAPGVTVTGLLSVCQGQAGVSYSVPNNAGSTYSWTIPAGASITSNAVLNTILVTFSSLGGDVSVIETTAGLCTTVHSPATVVVNPLPTAYNVTAPVAYCSGDPGVTVTLSNSQTGVNYQLYNSLGVVGAPLAGTTGSALTWANKVFESYHVVATNATTGCVATMNGTVVVSVNGIVPGSIALDQTICENDNPNPFTSVADAIGSGLISYQWQLSSDGITYGNILGATSSVYSSAPLIADTWYKRIAISSLGTSTCSSPSNISKVTVNNFVAGSILGVQTICDGSVPAALTSVTPTGDGVFTYQWKDSPDGITFANVAGALSETYAPGILNQDTWYKREVTSTFLGKACAKETNSVRVSVNNFVPGSISTAQTICDATAPDAFTSGPPSGDGTFTYLWQSSPDNATWSDILTATSATYTSPALTTDTYYRRRVTSTLNGTPCLLYTNSVLVIVNNFVPGSIAGDQTICEGTAPIAFTSGPPSGDGAYTYRWQMSLNGIAFSDISGATSEPYSPPVLSADTWYKRLVTSTLNSNTCILETNVVKVTVVNFSAGSISSSQTICNSTAPAAFTSVDASGDGAFTYQWKDSPDGTSFTDIGGATLATYAPGALTADRWYKRVVTSTLNLVPCILETNIIKITVNVLGQVNDPADQVVCNGTNTASVNYVTTNTGGVSTFTWTNSDISIGLAATGSGDISSFTATNVTTAPVVATIAVTPHYTNNSVTCNGPTQTFTIIVNPTGQVNDPADQVLCNGASTAAVNFTSNNTVGVTTYTWTNTASGIGLGASGAGNIGSFPAVNTGTVPVVATITVTPHFANASVTCDGPVQLFTITVNPTAQVNAPANQILCNTSAVSAVTFGTTNTGGLTTYAWTNDNITIGLAASGTGNIGSFAGTNAGTSPVTATIVVTSTFTNAFVSCTGPTQTFTIIVNPTGQVNDPADQVLCNGSATTAVNFTTSNTGGVPTYSWTNSATGIGLAASGTGDIGVFTASNITTSPVVAMITVTPHFANGSLTCNGPVQTFTITVNPTGQVNDPLDQVVCNAANTAAVNFTTNNAGGVTTYSWTNDTPGINLLATGAGNIPTFAATNASTAPVTATITVTPHFTNALLTCDGPVQTFTITVNPTGQVNAPINQVVCNGSSTAPVFFGTTNTGGTTTYTWTNDNTSIGLAAGGTGNIGAFAGINAGTLPVVANIIVTPHFANGSVTCNGPAQTFTITVNPTGQVNDPADQVVCNTASTGLVTFTTNNTVGVTTYSWTNNTVGMGLGASGTGNMPAFATINGGTLPVVATITVTPHFAYGAVICDGPVQTFTITVNPTGQLNDPADQVLCNGGNITSVNFGTTNTGGTTTYAWVNDTPGIGLAASGAGNIGTFAAVNAGTLPVVATITVTPTFTNGAVPCAGPAQTFTITVNPTAEVDVIANQAECNATATTAVAFTTLTTGGVTTYSWSNNSTSIGLAASGTGNIGSFTAVNTGSSSVTATITVTPHFFNAAITCDGPTKTFTITVNPTAQVNDPVDQVVCNAGNTSAVNFATTNTGGTTTYAWVNDNIAIGLGASGTGNILTFVAANLTTAPVTANITVTPTFANGSVNCTGPSQTFTITVNPTAQVTNPGSQVLCNGSATTAVTFATVNTGGTTTYSWTNNATGINLAASGTGDIPIFTASSITTSPIVATISVTPHFANGSVTCNGPVMTFTITVNPTAQVTQPASQTVCNAGSTTLVTFATLNTGGVTGYTWTNDTPGIGLAASGVTSTIPVFAGINLGTSPVTATIVVTPTFTNALVGCVGPTKTFTITVNPAGQVTPPTNQVVCNGSSTSTVTFATTNTGGTTTYTWANDLTSIGLGASGSGDIPFFTANNAGTAPVVATIAVTPHFVNNSVSCSGTPQTFTITVNPKGQVTQPANQVVCNGTNSTLVTLATVNTGGATTFAWTNDTPGIGLAVSGTGNVPVFSAINAGTSPIIATIVVTPTYTNTVGCAGTTKTFTITVNPTGQVNAPSDQVVCNAANTTAVNFGTTNTGGVTTYTWGNSDPGINLAAGGTGNIASFAAANLTTAPVTATITVTPHFANGSLTCDGPAQTFTITVNPTARLTNPGNQVLCNGSTTAAVNFVTLNTVGTTTYTWTNNATSIGLAANGTGDIGTFTAVNIGTSPVVATISVTPHFDNAGVVCDGPVQNFTITVNPTAQVTQPVNQVVCNTFSTFLITFATLNSGGTTDYTWTNDNIAIGLGASGSGGTIAAFTGTNGGTLPITANIVVTPTFTNALLGCPGPAKTFTITVNPTGQVNNPGNQVVCNGSSTSTVSFSTANTGGATTYTWTNNTTSIGLGASGSGDIPFFTATNATTAPVVATIVVTPTFTNAGKSCNGLTETFTITVNPTAQVQQPASEVVCNGATTTLVTFATLNTVGTTTYAWTNDNTSIGLAASGTTNTIAPFTATNTGSSPVVATIVVTPTFTNGVACTGPSKTFTITVNPTAQVNAPANQVLCNGSNITAVTFGTTNTGGTTTYTWTNDTPGINLAVSGTTNIGTFAANNATNAPVIATIVVTPTFTNGGKSCTGPNQTLTITVNPTGQVTNPGNQEVCNGGATTAITFATTRTGGTTTYSWTNSATGIGLAATGIGDIVSFTASNITTSPVTATIVVTPTYANGSVNCTGPSQTFTIIVNPTAQVNKPVDQVVCNATGTTAIVNFTTNNTGGTTSYNWTNSDASIGLAAIGSGSIAAFTATNAGTAPLTATITVTPTFTNGVPCTGPAQTFTITVNPTGQVNAVTSQVVCNGSSTTPIFFGTANSVGTTTYTWANDNTSIGLAASGTGNIGAFAGINSGTVPAVATITVTPHFANGSVTCDGPVKTFTITVNPTGQVTQPASKVLCNGDNSPAVVFGTSNTGGTTTYSWTNDDTSIGLGASGSGDLPLFVAANAGTAPITATIVVTTTFTNTTGCAGPSKTFTITVNPTGQVNDPGDQVVCNAGSTSAVTFGTINTGGVTTYTWTNSNTSINLGAGGTGNIASFTATNVTTAPVTATITVIPHFKNALVTCDGPAKTFTITVNPTAQVNAIANQVECNGIATAAINFTTINTVGVTTYSWSNNSTSIGLGASGTGNIGSFTAVNTGSSPVTATITVTPHFTNATVTCDGPTQSLTITVNPTAQVNKPADQVVCNAANTSTVNFATTNTGGLTTYTWVNDNAAIGLAAGGSGNILTFAAANLTTAPVTANITVTPSFANGSVSCTGPTQTFSITVNPTAQVTNPGNQVLCNGSATTAVTFATLNTGGTTTYSWTNNATGINLAASGTGDIPIFTVSNISTAPIVATIAVTPHYTNASVTCTGLVQNFTITVNPTGQVTQPANQTVCNTASTSIVNFATVNSGGVTSYSWTNDTPGIGLAASGLGVSIPAFAATNPGTSPVTATIVVTPIFTNAALGCPGPTKTFTITVNPTGQVNLPAVQVVCNGSSISNVIFGTTNTGGTTTYTWTNDLPGIGLGASGSGDIPFFTAVNGGTVPVIATITVTPHFTNNAVACTGTQQTFTITVNPKGQVTQPVSQVVCNATNSAAVNFATVNTGGVTTYTWTNDNTAIGLGASGIGDISAFLATNAGTSPITANIVVTPTFTNLATGCTGTSKSFTITINPTGQVNAPADQVVCNAGNTSTVSFTTGNLGGTTTYSWTNNNTTIGLAASGTGNIGSFIAINTGTLPVVATATVTPHYLNGAVNCDGPVQTFTITVNPTAQVNLPANQVICNGSATTPVNFATVNTVGVTTYTWTNSASGIGLGASGTGNIASFVAVNTGTSPVTATITVTPHFTNVAVTCDGPVQTFTITVNPTGQVNKPANLLVCNTNSASVVFVTNNTGGITTYSWANDNAAIGLAVSGTGNITPFAATNAGTSPIFGTITVTPHFTNGAVTCDGPAQTFTITVNPTGQVDDPVDQVMCNGSYSAPVTFTTVNTGGTTTFTWTNDLTSIGLGASGTGNISAFPAVNAGTTLVTATITVTPHFTNGLVTCDGPAQTFTIIVNPKGQVNDPADQVVCNATATSAVNFVTTNSGGLSTFTWVNDNTTIGLAASGTGNIGSFTATNAGTSPVVATITVTPHFANVTVTCDGPVQTFTITVNPTGQVNLPADQVVCNGSSSASVIFVTTNTGGTTTYTWNNSLTSIGLGASGTGNILPFTAVNASTLPVVATITVTPHFANGSVTCDGPPQSFTITVNPTPNVSTASPLIICSTTATNIALTSNVAGAAFSWTVGGVTGGISGATASSGSTIAQILINPGTTPGTVTYIVTPTANSCSGIPVNIVVIVNPTPNVTTLGPTTICSAATTNIALFSNVAGSTFSWTVGAVTGGITGATASSGATIAQMLTNPGTTSGSVTYIVTPTANSCPGAATNVVVTVNPTPNVATVGLTTICSATAVSLPLTSTVTGTTFSWTIGTTTGGVFGATASNGSTIAQTLTNLGLTPGTVEYLVTPTANSCLGPATSIVVSVNPSTGATSFTSGAIEVCQDGPDETYIATATNSTSIVYSVTPAAAGTINAASGVMNWAPAFSGTATIMATSAGLCGTTVGTLAVRVKQLPSITISPVNRTTCEFGMVNFDVTALGSDLSYQWFVNDNSGPGFVPVVGAGTYFGENSSTLQIFSAGRDMNSYKYHVVVSGCLPDVTSGDALLTVNTAPELTLHPSDSTICLGSNATMSADANGTTITWQWLVNKGVGGFVPVVDDGIHFTGSTTKILTITNALIGYNNWVFRAKATGICGVPTLTNFGRLSVINPPAVGLQPLAKVVCENGTTSFLGNGSGYTGLQWQISTDGGTVWTNITDDATYVGAETNQLTILSAPVTLNGNKFRLGLIGACTTTNTNGVLLTVNPNPVVNFAAIDPIYACGGVPVVMNGNPTGGTAPYTQHRWTGDVGPLSSYILQKPIFNSQIADTFNLNYKVTDSKGCTANANIAVIVDSPSATFTTDVNIDCTPLTVTFTKDMTGISKFVWNFDDGSPKDSVNANPVHTFTDTSKTAINYRNVKLTVYSAGGCKATYTSLVTVYPAISATFTASKLIVCSGTPIVFTAVPGASKYSWDYGDGTSEPGTNSVSHPYSNFTTGPLVLHVKLTTTSFYNCFDIKTLDITVMPVPIPQFSAAPPSQVYSSAGNPVVFTNNTNAGTWTWLWKFGDGATSTLQNPTHPYTALGDYKVVLIVNNANCSDSISHTVSILPEKPIANFDLVPSGCVPLSVTINNTTTHTEIPGTTYYWDFGDGYTSTAKNPTYTYFDAGSFIIKLTVTGPGGKTDASQVVNSNPSPKAYFEVSPNFVFVNDEKVRCFNLSTPSIGNTYLWEFGDGDTSKVKEPFHKYMEAGVFDITLWATSENGCTDKYVLSPGITVEPAGNIRFASVFTPDLTGPIEGPPTTKTMDQFFFPPIREKVIDNSYKLQIFNRLGVLIFQTDNINVAWNGYYKGQLCPQGVYVWYVEGKYANGTPFKKVGDITLLH